MPDKEIIPVKKEDRKGPYWESVNEVIDPEVGIGVVDLGLIYQINQDKEGHTTIVMTLTSPACPVGPVLVQQIQDQLQQFPEVSSVETEIVWDPVWTQDRIDPDIRELMFGI